MEKYVFIIAHKYYRGYESYINLYIDRINQYYPNNLIVVVDNNSDFKDDILIKLKKYDNVVFLENDIESKFELGAYQVGINFLLKNDLLDRYEFFIFTQDTFILNKKFDFFELKEKNVLSCPISYGCGSYDFGFNVEKEKILKSINLYDKLDEIKFCFCNSFIIKKEKINQYYDLTKNIKILNRSDSEASERYLSRILYELNEHKNYQIDDCSKYDGYTINPYNNNAEVFFVKKFQQKNEKTKNI